MLHETAPAKVNLYLHVVGRREDGYHVLDSLAVFPGAADELRAEVSDGLTLRIEGPCAAGLDAGEGNLVLRAARALAASAGVEARAALVLVKRLPVASGIGGGSADAAAALRVLARLWGVDVDLRRLAGGLGADVPVCVASRAARMGGVGEVLSAAPGLPRFGMVLVNPGVGVSTPEVFRARRGGFRAAAALPGGWPDAPSMARGLAGLSNDLERAAVEVCPVIEDVLAWLRVLPGCLLARMSGSGATCFGLFAGQPPALPDLPAGWWSWSGLAL